MRSRSRPCQVYGLSECCRSRSGRLNPEESGEEGCAQPSKEAISKPGDLPSALARYELPLWGTNAGLHIESIYGLSRLRQGSRSLEQPVTKWLTAPNGELQGVTPTSKGPRRIALESTTPQGGPSANSSSVTGDR